MYFMAAKATVAERRTPNKIPRISCRFFIKRCRCSDTSSIADSIPRNVAAVKLDALGASIAGSVPGRVVAARLETFAGFFGESVPRKDDGAVSDGFGAASCGSIPSKVGEAKRDFLGGSFTGLVSGRVTVVTLGAFGECIADPLPFPPAGGAVKAVKLDAGRVSIGEPFPR